MLGVLKVLIMFQGRDVISFQNAFREVFETHVIKMVIRVMGL